jgi:hypothetical protein
MKDKKHIDSLFKDRFKNFEAAPSPEVWNRIHAQLEKEDSDKKVIPLWFKLAGVAALLALLFTVGSMFFNPSNITTNPEFTTTEEINNEVDGLKEDVIFEDKSNTTEIASEDDKTETQIELNEENDNFIKKSSTNNSNLTESKIAVENNNTNKSTNTSASEKQNPLLIKDSEANKLIKKAISEKTATAVETDTEEKTIKSESSIKDSESIINKETTISKTTKIEDAVTETNLSNSEELNKEAEIEETDKPSIFDAIDKKNKVEEAVAINDNTPDNRWDVTPNFAPVFYNSLEEGSSIDPSFADNAQSGDVN